MARDKLFEFKERDAAKPARLGKARDAEDGQFIARPQDKGEMGWIGVADF